MKRAAILGGLAVAMAASMFPAPQTVLKSRPQVFYGAAVYKSMVGDAEGTLRMLQKSVEEVPAPAAMRTAASTCSGTPRG